MPYTALLSALSSLPLDGYTSDQREALGTLYEYIEEPSPYALFLLTGYAGTGKTFLLRTIADLAHRAGLRVELMARRAEQQRSCLPLRGACLDDSPHDLSSLYPDARRRVEAFSWGE